MRLALYHTDTVRSSWSNWAAARAIRRLGHEVVDCPVPTDRHGAVRQTVSRAFLDRALRTWPTLEELSELDAVVVMGPEYVQPWLDLAYSNKRTTATPYVALALEAYNRPGYANVFDRLAGMYDVWGWCNTIDAERGGFYIRPGVDCHMFCPDSSQPKRFDAGFIGTVYERRAEFLSQLELPSHIDFAVGEPLAFDLGGECQELWTQLYVRSLRQLCVHVDLPSNNPMATARPYETLAAGTFCLTWARLPAPLEEGRHYVRYDPRYPQEVAEALEHYLAHDEERESIAAAGCAMLHKHFASEQAWAGILAHVGGGHV